MRGQRTQYYGGDITCNEKIFLGYSPDLINTVKSNQCWSLAAVS